MSQFLQTWFVRASRAVERQATTCREKRDIGYFIRSWLLSQSDETPKKQTERHNEDFTSTTLKLSIMAIASHCASLSCRRFLGSTTKMERKS